jgi:hypothetical protein
MTVPGGGDGETVLACSGNVVVAWCPKSAAQQHRSLDIQHSAQVNAVGWLGKGKALAVAGEDRVLNIYSAEAKIVATAPKAHLLPPNAPSITSLVVKGHNVVYGGSNGLMQMAKLPELTAVTLHHEPSKAITGLALTPKGLLVAARCVLASATHVLSLVVGVLYSLHWFKVDCSENGNVLMTQSDAEANGRRPHYLSCRDREARCSIAASTVSEQVVAGSFSGGINWWDAAAGSAEHYIQDQVQLQYSPSFPICTFRVLVVSSCCWWCRI